MENNCNNWLCDYCHPYFDYWEHIAALRKQEMTYFEVEWDPTIRF